MGRVWRRVFREIQVALLNDVVLGTILFVVVWLWQGGVWNGTRCLITTVRATDGCVSAVIAIATIRSAPGLESYLETVRWADPSTRAQERLYERHGFAVAEVVPMTDDWSMVSMKRPAATTSGG